MPCYILVFIIVSFSISYEVFAQNKTLPDGWRLPNKEESVVKWRPEGMAPYLVVKEDFNGDGVTDEARILVNIDKANFYGLFVFLSIGNKIETMLLDTSSDKHFLKYMGIFPAKQGVYKTACAKGYGKPCGKGEPEEVTLLFPSIDYFMSEGAKSYFYWDKQIGSFKRIWISD